MARHMPGFFFYLTAGAIYDNMISLFIPASAPSNRQAQRYRQAYGKIRFGKGTLCGAHDCVKAEKGQQNHGS